MTVRLIVVSGGLASGKTALAERLQSDFGCRLVKTSDIIRRLDPGAAINRVSLQRAGNRLDRSTKFSWIAREVAKEFRSNDSGPPVVLEGVRKPRQMEEIQKAIGHRYVRHVHLSVDEQTQKERFEASKRMKDSGLSFEEAINDVSEKQVRQLQPEGRHGDRHGAAHRGGRVL